MFYLFEVAYKFGLHNVSSEFYELAQIIAEDQNKIENILVDIYANRNILESKVIKATPITSPFITHSMSIPDRIYHQFECIKTTQKEKANNGKD